MCLVLPETYEELVERHKKKELAAKSDHKSLFVTAWMGGQPELKDGELKPIRRGNETHLSYAARAFEHFQVLVLKRLYGRKWRRKKGIVFRWFGQTEVHDKRGHRCALHVHSRLEACALDRSFEEVVQIITEAWDEAATKFFLFTPEIDVQWLATAEEAASVDAYIRKRVDNPVGLQLIRPPVGHREMLKVSRPK